MGGYALVWRHSASTCTGWQVGAGKEESFFVKRGTYTRVVAHYTEPRRG